MKKCPFCSEEIQDEAIKCKHCREFLDESIIAARVREKQPWYFGTPFIVFALCAVGPLALPLIWWRPQTGRAWKVGLTLGVLVLSWFLYEATLESLKTLREYRELMRGL